MESPPFPAFFPEGKSKFLPKWKKKVIIGHFTGMNGKKGV